MGRHAANQDPLHVLYVGSSADLGALRRLMEAHGAVTRCRLTPEVTVVIVDSSVSADHPTVRTAGTLGIPVMEPAEAIIQFAGWRSRTESGLPAWATVARLPAPPAEPIRPAPTARRSWLFRRSTQ
ncbi:MAG: hypothetical protein JO309_03650 [Pseudonocardiales bacterium]|nr:hypothetical protein [Pseudonocardiales bacterium]MBV9728505.1 hypothetical protein [Pseudonocardiales bacterium]